MNLTFLNTVNRSNMIKRLRLRKSLNRYDKFNNNFYQRVQNGFLKIASKKDKKYQIIDSNLDKRLNSELIINRINKIV